MTTRFGTIPKRKWIVMSGQPIDTMHGGGFEFFGPFTEKEAKQARAEMIKWHADKQFAHIVVAIELLHYGTAKIIQYGKEMRGVK